MRMRWNLPSFLAAAALPAMLHAGWPFTADGPRRGTPEWYELHAGDPVGQRQQFKFGKSWPTVPRPMGEPAPLVHKFHHNLYWPHPYVDLDRQAIEEVKAAHIAKGWEQATTLYEYHFDSQTQSLNSSGRDHLYWILSTVPMEFRTTYVQASPADPSISSARLANVQSEAARVLGGQQIAVLLRVATPIGTPATDVDAVYQYRRENLTPPPVLGETGAGGGESGG